MLIFQGKKTKFGNWYCVPYFQPITLSCQRIELAGLRTQENKYLSQPITKICK